MDTPAAEPSAYRPTLALGRSKTFRFIGRSPVTLTLRCVLMWTGSVGCLWLNESRIVFRRSARLRRSRPLDPAVFRPLHRLVPLDAARSCLRRLKDHSACAKPEGHNSAGFTSLSELSEALSTSWPSGAAAATVH
jgi:hypothetical protein